MKKISEKRKEKLEKEKKERIEMYNFFLYLWDEIEKLHGKVVCYETGIKLSDSMRNTSLVYHHVLEKENYPEYRMKAWNIVIVHPDIHAQCHSNIDKTPKIKKRREDLLNNLNQEKL